MGKRSFGETMIGLVTPLSKSRDLGANYAYFRRLADLEFERDQFSIATSLYQIAIENGESDVAVYFRAAHAYLCTGRTQEAAGLYEKARSTDTTAVSATLGLARCRIDEGRSAEARALLEDLDTAVPGAREEIAALLSILDASESQRGANADVYEGARELEENAPAVDSFACDLPYQRDARIDTSLFPFPVARMYREHPEEFVIRRNGTHQCSQWGEWFTARGIDCLRGHIVSSKNYIDIEVYIDGKLVAREPMEGAPLAFEKSNQGLRKYSYNVWIDFRRFTLGWHVVILRGINNSGFSEEGKSWRREHLIVAEPFADDCFKDADSIVDLPNNILSGQELIDEVNALPTRVSNASTASYPGSLDRIAVIRVDQLGDLAVSYPAIKRLRELAPNAHITGILSPANAGLGRSFGLFDDIIEVSFPDDRVQGKRVLSFEAQQAFIKRLQPLNLDLALDLSVDGASRRLLKMTGAKVTMGFGKGDFKTLDVQLVTRDPKTGNDIMRHSARTRFLVETLKLWLNSEATPLRRDDLERTSLSPYGIGVAEKFVVLHTGSRIKFTQWPYYTQLANELATTHGTKVVFIADNPQQRALLDDRLIEEGKIIYVEGLLPTDVFDAMLSYCAVFVGNDSGPKHLASLRGANVISLHSSRIAWTEWGQEHGGVVLSRRVPCAGCCIHHEPEECAKDVVCIKGIKIEEVLSEVVKYI